MFLLPLSKKTFPVVHVLLFLRSECEPRLSVGKTVAMNYQLMYVHAPLMNSGVSRAKRWEPEKSYNYRTRQEYQPASCGVGLSGLGSTCIQLRPVKTTSQKPLAAWMSAFTVYKAAAETDKLFRQLLNIPKKKKICAVSENSVSPVRSTCLQS